MSYGNGYVNKKNLNLKWLEYGMVFYTIPTYRIQLINNNYYPHYKIIVYIVAKQVDIYYT